MAGQQKQRILTLPLEQFVWFTLGLSQIFCPLCGLSWINLLNLRSIARETWWKTFQDGPFSLKFWHRTMPRRGGRFWGSLTIKCHSWGQSGPPRPVTAMRHKITKHGWNSSLIELLSSKYRRMLTNSFSLQKQCERCCIKYVEWNSLLLIEETKEMTTCKWIYNKI